MPLQNAMVRIYSNDCYFIFETFFERLLFEQFYPPDSDRRNTLKYLTSIKNRRNTLKYLTSIKEMSLQNVELMFCVEVFWLLISQIVHLLDNVFYNFHLRKPETKNKTCTLIINNNL